MSIAALRTPEERLTNLPGFPYEPSYLTELPGYEGLRLAYVDEGSPDGPVFLCLHGEPTWSFLYRKMIPVFVEAGARVVAPDFFGFGRSDKPLDDGVYTWSFHRGALTAFIAALELEPFTLVCQDWGGLLGLTLPVDRPEAIERLLIMNTALVTGEMGPSEGFEQWKAFMAGTEDLDVPRLMKRAVPGISDAEAAAYGAPFPDVRYKAGVRTFPALVPLASDMEGAAISKRAEAFWREQWSGPTFMAVGAQDPVLGPPVMTEMQRLIRGCPEPMVLDDAGHFVQEKGDRIARAALEAWADGGEPTSRQRRKLQPRLR